MQVEFTLTGLTPLLFHADDIEAADELAAWRKDPANKNLSVPGDDRSPPWTWQTYLYFGPEEHLAWPSQNLMVGLRQAGTQMILKRQKTFKEITQSGLFIDSEFCRFTNGEQQIPIASIRKLRNLLFKAQGDAVRGLGFRLFCKRAVIGKAKHVRVRARFERWTISGTVNVIAPEITWEHLEQLFEIAGRVGQGDWRPGCKTPGPFGMFRAQLKKSK